MRNLRTFDRTGARYRGLDVERMLDSAVEDTIRRFEATGSPVVTDGEQLVRFVSIGAVSTVLFATLFLLLQPGLGAQSANLVALLVTAVANTASWSESSVMPDAGR